MFGIFYIFLFPLLVVSTELTFENVEFKGYSVFTLKFTKTIIKSNNLKENVPAGVIFDHLGFLDQNIPVIRDNSIRDLDNLDELTIEHCQVREVEPGAFKNVPLLRTLSLKGNELKEVRTGVFNNLQLSRLDLSKNQIKSIEATALDNLPNLLNIHLADNYIREWNKRWFQNTPLLIRISMQNNSLETIPSDAFTNLKGNKNYGSLKLNLNLIFSHNKISRIEHDAFRGLKKINNLWLDHNNLHKFQDTLLEDVEVKELRLNQNSLSCLTGDLSKIIKAEATYLDGNEFHCACLDQIKNWAKEHDKTIYLFFSNMDCLADGIRVKLDDLNKRLKDGKVETGREREDTTAATDDVDDEVEILFK